jgi:hypothetical protein
MFDKKYHFYMADFNAYVYLLASTFWSCSYCRYIQILLPEIKTVFFFPTLCTEALILEQKNLKIEHELDFNNKEERALNRSIASLNNKLLLLNSKLCERKDFKETLDKDNLHTQYHYMNILKVCLAFK